MTLNNLRSELFKRHIKQTSVAESLGMTPSNFSKKIGESVPFTVNEVKAIQTKYLPDLELGYICESDGDVPAKRVQLHSMADAIGNALTNDGEEPDPEVDEIVQQFHECADCA